MALTRPKIKANVIANLAGRLQRPITDFATSDELRTKWKFSDNTLRAWGRELHQAAWYTGWFGPTEILACHTINDVIELLYRTQVGSSKDGVSNLQVAGDYKPPAGGKARLAPKTRAAPKPAPMRLQVPGDYTPPVAPRAKGGGESAT